MWNKLKDSKVLYVAISVVVAIVLWMYVDLTVEPDAHKTIHNIPVTFVGEDRLEEESLMIADSDSQTVTLTLTGNRSALSQLNRENVTVRVDAASQVRESGQVSLDYLVIFPNSINTNSVKVRSRSIASINVTVLRMKRKTVALRGYFNGSVAKGYLYDANRFSYAPRQITIRGEESLVDRVDHACVTLNEQGLSSTWNGTLDITLQDSEGNGVDASELTLSEESVEVTFPVFAVKEVPLSLQLEAGGGATEKDAEVTIVPATVTVSGDADALHDLEEVRLGTVSLGDIITTQSQEMAITMPEGFENVSSVTTADVTVSIGKELATRKFKLHDIHLRHAAEGLEVEMVTQEVELRIRGPKESMALLMDRDILVAADLTDVEAGDGECTVPLLVNIQGFSDVGVVGSYEVTVNALWS